MIANLLLTSWRSLKKHKFFSVLNIFGLAVGMAVFLLIAQYIYFERSFETFLPNAGNVYRVSLEAYQNNELVFHSAENYPGIGPAMTSEIPEVTGYARLYNAGYKNNVVITNEDALPNPIALKVRKYLYADSALLPMLGYEMVAGDPATALAEPFTAVISDKYARMFFGDEDPIGKSLRLQDDDFNNELAKVTGVFKELPSNTHLKFDVLFSYKTLFTRGDFAVGRYDQGWFRKDMYTFVSIRPGANIAAVENKLPAIISKYKPDMKEKNVNEILHLQAFGDIHLRSNLAEEPEINGDERIVGYLSMIGLFVLVIAWINYINLSTARAMDRAKEVGVRKVMGAMKAQLVRQFITEAALINFISMLVAIVLVMIVLPWFNALSGLSLDISYLAQTWFIGLSFTLWLTGSLLSGFYPALVLSSFRPVAILKGKLKNTTSGIFLRKSLVVFQFMASVALIAGTFIVYNQMQFMMGQDLGMNIDQVLVVERPGIAPRDRKAFNSAIDVFREEVKKDAGVTAITASATVPGKQREYKIPVKKYGAPDDRQVIVRFNSMDFEFMDVFGMKLIAGRVFAEEFIKDPDTSVVISESTAKLLGFANPQDAVGATLTVTPFEWSPLIVGVVNDYHQVSLKQSIDPTVFYCTEYDGEIYSIRLNTTTLTQTVDHIRNSWSKAFPGNPFEYYFLDDFFNRQYENEQKFGKLFTTFAGFAVVVGCLGLFGLSAYTATQRTKEIGIRKALGSSEQGIFYLLSQEYVKLVLLSIALSTPLVWWGMNIWLQQFPYRLDISVFVFLAAGGIVLSVAIITISYQTISASKTNPVDALRYE
jgi:putative ABC transport system permease protein